MSSENKKKYRRFLLWSAAFSFTAAVWLGYRYYDRKIPDKVQIAKGESGNISGLLEAPFLSFGETTAVSADGSCALPCSVMGVIPFKDVKITPVERKNLMVSGSTVGIYLETDGVLVVDTGEILSDSGTLLEPAKNIVQPGDYIVAFNEQKVTSKRQLMDDLSGLDVQKVTLRVQRNGEEIPLSVTPVKDSQGDYKLGLWVRDDTQGIGTLTYVDEKGGYGALGHGISDVDTGELLSIDAGDLYRAEILSIRKGAKGTPGELAGLIRYDKSNVIGSIRGNTSKGIYGTLNPVDESISLREMPIGYKQEMEIGPASILCCLGEGVQEYEAEITKIDMNHEDTNKSFVIRITDEELLEKTGGIVQGMSGSPVIQNGRIVGAVTHVFVQDASTGYGIFIETMLEQ